MDERMDGSTEKPYLIRLSLYIWRKSSINLKPKCQDAFAGWKFNKRKFRMKLNLQNYGSKHARNQQMFLAGAIHQKSKIFNILKLFYMKYTKRHPVFFVLSLHLTTYKWYILQFSFGYTSGWVASWPIIVWYSNISFKLWHQAFSFIQGTLTF